VPEGARFCPSCGHEQQRRSDERRVVTVLFADLVGFTSLSEAADPEQVKNLVDSAFEHLVGVITSFGGRVDKIVGDAIVALFGAPTAHEDDPERAVRAALRMQEVLALHAADAGADIRMRVGVNTGEVLVGALRAGGDYTAMGDTVNTASRLETSAAPGEVLVGPTTWGATQERIAYEDRGAMAVKGRDEPVDVHAALRPILPPGHRTRRLRAPLVGRDAEMELLCAAVRATVEHDRAHLLLLYGEAGVGKSRLAEEVSAVARTGHDAAVFEGRCVPYGEANVWWPIAGAVRQACELEPDATEEEARGQVRSTLVRVHEEDAEGAGLDQDAIVGSTEALLHLMGYEGALRDVDPARARDEATDAALAFLEASARRQPVVIVLSDLHWADELVLELVDRLLERLGRLPCVLLATSRHHLSERWQPAPGRHNAVVLSLDPLDAEASAALVHSLFEGRAPAGLAELLTSRSGGNPFFLEELVALMEGNAASVTSDLTSDRIVRLPDTLRGLVAARLDGLSADERAVLADASVLGTRAPVFGLREMARHMRDQDDIDPQLSGLVAKEILLVDAERDLYEFRSDLMRDVAYSTITKVDRARAHAGIGAYLLTHKGDAPAASAEEAHDAQVEQVAHHLGTAAALVREMGPVRGVPEDIASHALTWVAEAAERAARDDIQPGAARLYGQALALVDEQPSPQRVQLLLGRGLARARLRQRAEAQGDIEAALAEAEACDDAGGFAHGVLVRGIAEELDDDFAAAVVSYDEAVHRLDEVGDETRRAEALRHRGMAELFLGENAKAGVSIAEALEAARAGGDRATEAWALQNLAWIAYSRGDADEADHHLQASIQLFEEVGDRSGLGWALGLLAWVRFHQGQREEAEQLAERVLPDIDRRSDRWGQGMMSLLIACARLWSGRAAAAGEPAEEASRFFDEIGDRWGRVQAIAADGRAAVALGQVRRGMDLFDRALAIELSDSDHRGSAAIVGGAHSALAVGDPEQAEAILSRWTDRALDPRAIGDREVGVARGLVALQRGRVPEALELLGAAAGEGRDEGGPPARAALALAVAADGRADEARALAEPVAASTDAATYLDRAHALLALGLSAAAVGDREASDRWFSQARREVDATDDVLTQAVVRLGLAQSLRHLGSEGAVWAQADAETRFTPMGVTAHGWSTVFSLIAPDADPPTSVTDADGPAPEGRPVGSS
jgi:class 3 adenylate cyclase/tetratricopeptide (TPR) repeat protein